MKNLEIYCKLTCVLSQVNYDFCAPCAHLLRPEKVAAEQKLRHGGGGQHRARAGPGGHEARSPPGDRLNRLVECAQ